MVYDPLKNPQNLLGSTPINSSPVGSVGSNSAITGVVAPPTDLRSVISQTAKPGYIQGFDTQQGYAPVFVPRGTYVPGISATNKDLTTGSMAPVAGFTLPDGTQGNQIQLDAQMAAAKAYSDSQAKLKADELAANPLPTKEANQFQDILNNMVTGAEAGTTALTERSTALQGQELKDLTTQRGIVDQKIGENLARSAALDASYQNENMASEGRNFNKFALAGEQAQNYRQYLAQKNSLAAETQILQATSLGLSGRITEAKNTINEAFQSKVDIINAQTKSWLAQADAIRPALNKQETAQLEKVKAEKAKELQDATDLKNAQIKAGNDLLDAGVNDSSAMVEISKAKTASEVAGIMSRFAPQLSRLGQLKIQNEEAQLQKMRADVIKAQNDNGVGTVEDKQKTANQLAFLKDTAKKAEDLAGASGQGSIWRRAGALIKGSTKSNQLEQLEDTLKTNILSLATDPVIKKFFGPQMSEADVRMMMAGGTTLNHIAQTPEQAKEEIKRLTDLFDRMSKAVGVEPSGKTPSSDNPPKGADGTAYGFPGYVSDGTQWVKK